MTYAISGQVSVVTPGTAVQGPEEAGTFLIVALQGNSGNIFLGNDGAGDVDSTNGLTLAAGDSVPFVGALSTLWVDCEAGNTDGYAWFRVADIG